MRNRKLLPSILLAIVYGIAWGGLGSVPTILSQVTTSITPDNSLGTTVTQDGNMFNIDNGTITGTNQFQSFGEFNLGDGDIASFNGPAGIENVLSRVTGGNPSNIFGTLRSTIDGANLFFMNPAGVIFGPTASLDISGSFHTTTADYLKLGEDGIFYAALGEDSFLTVAGVEAFGFVNPKPSNISVERSSLGLPNGEAFSLVGGDISVLGNPGREIPSVEALEGQVNLVSVSSPGEVTFSETGEPIVSSFSSLGDIYMSENAFITLEDFNSTTGGTVRIRGGQFVMEDAAIVNQTYAERSGGPVSIIASKEVSIGGESLLFNSTLGDGDGGSLEIRAPLISLSGNVVMQTRTAGIGNGGSISLTAGSLILSEGAAVESVTTGLGNAGQVTLNIDQLNISGGAQVSSAAKEKSSGFGGMVTINSSGPVSISGQNSGILSFSFEEIDGGEISLTASEVSLEGGATISAQSFGLGNAGNLFINAGEQFVSQNSSVTTEVAQADGGDIEIQANSLIQLTNSRVTTTLTGERGHGGNIRIASEIILIGENNQITADVLQGPGGNVLLESNFLFVDQSSTISASSGLAITRFPIEALAETIAPLPKDFVSPVSLFASPCVAQQGGQLSSFVQSPRDMTPPQPEDPLASPLFFDTPNLNSSRSGSRLKQPGTDLTLHFSNFPDLFPNLLSTQPRPSLLLTGCEIS